MNIFFLIVCFKNVWCFSYLWIFQKLVEKLIVWFKFGFIVDVVGIDGEFIGRGFYNGYLCIVVCIFEIDQNVLVDVGWFLCKIVQVVLLCCEVLKFDVVFDVWCVVYSEGDGLFGLVVDCYGDLVVVEFFVVGMFCYCEWIYDVLCEQFFGCCFYSFVDEYVQKQESFDFYGNIIIEVLVIIEYGIKFCVDLVGVYKIGFFVDQCENCEWLSQQVEGKSVFDLCCNIGGFVVYVVVCGVFEVIGIDIDEDVIQIVKGNLCLNNVCLKFIQFDIFLWLCDVVNRGEQYDVVILDLVKMICDCDQVIIVLKKYLDMNKLVLGVVKLGGLFVIFLCIGLVVEDQFFDMLCWVVYFFGCMIQILKVVGVGLDYLFMVYVQELCYLKVVFCCVVD